METDPVNHMVGVISIEMGPSQVWFNITGETQRGKQFMGVWSTGYLASNAHIPELLKLFALGVGELQKKVSQAPKGHQ